MNTDHVGFLRTIIESPDDDGPRLICADWLDENGQPERAEFIRLQCALESMPRDDARRDEVANRELTLRKRHQMTWAREALPLVVGMLPTYTFRRGFIEELAIQSSYLEREAERIFSLCPLRILTIHHAHAHFRGIAANPFFSRIHTLGMMNSSISDYDIQCFSLSPHFTRLRTLNLNFNDIGNVGIRALASSAIATDLRALYLSHNRLDVDGARVIANAFPCLQSLDMSLNRIGRRGKQMLRSRFGEAVEL